MAIPKRLRPYRAKRRLSESKEPAPKLGKGGKQLQFVVQKHAARQLHYDFRLEWDGVLKSWAVPKGPPEEMGIKRLAIQVEDHPYAYKDFEGVIPSGYGAGQVWIWDRGTYQMEGSFEEGIEKGALHFTLRGKKLVGEFSLIRLKNKDNQWLWMRRNAMPGKKHLKGVSKKEQRMYEHIKESAKKTGRYGKRAAEVAARTVLKQHKKKGHAKGK